MESGPLPADRQEGDRSPQLDALAADLVAEANRLIDLPGFGEDYDLGRLVRSLLMWSLTLGRMAESGPASLRSVGRGFRDHPEHGLPDPDPLASHRALLDVVSFLTVGDMVLDDLAAMLLTRWHHPPGRKGVPWRLFMNVLDGSYPDGAELRGFGRYLDLVLREARARIVAHRSRRHAMSSGWAPDGSFRVSMISLDDRTGAEQELFEILQRAGREPGYLADYDTLADYVIEAALLLDKEMRCRVVEAFERGGYHVYEPLAIVGALVGLTVTIQHAKPRRPPRRERSSSPTS